MTMPSEAHLSLHLAKPGPKEAEGDKVVLHTPVVFASFPVATCWDQEHLQPRRLY